MGDFQYQILMPLRTVVNAGDTLYTNTSATASYVRGVFILNTSGNATTLKLHYVNSGSIGSSGTLFSTISIGALTSSFVIPELPGIMFTQSQAYLSSSCTGNPSLNMMIVGGVQ